MTDQMSNGASNGNGQDGMEVNGALPITVNAQYVKDLSFENPNAPHTLTAGQPQPSIDLQVDVQAIRMRNWMAWFRFDEAKGEFNPKRTFYVPVKEGLVATDFVGWLRASKQIPEVGRIVQLLDYLQGDPASRTEPGAFVPDPARSKEAVATLAAAVPPHHADGQLAEQRNGAHQRDHESADEDVVVLDV
mgnify:CR=1 FL=1